MMTGGSPGQLACRQAFRLIELAKFSQAVGADSQTTPGQYPTRDPGLTEDVPNNGLPMAGGYGTLGRGSEILQSRQLGGPCKADSIRPGGSNHAMYIYTKVACIGFT